MKGKTKLTGIKFPCFCELKYDGEYNEYQMGMLTNKYGKVKLLPHIAHELQGMKEILCGELYYGNGEDGDLYKLGNKTSPDLKFAIFDIKLPGSYRERRERLLEIFEPTTHCHVVQTKYCSDSAMLETLFDLAIDDGFEGVMVKNEDSFSNNWVKMKRKQTADLIVFTIDPIKERIEVLVPFDYGKRTTNVGVKCTNKQKKDLAVGDVVEIIYQSQLPSGSLRHPVFKRKREPGKVVSI